MKKLTDENRLSVVRPDLAAEWNYDKNGELTPENISFGSNKKVWWKCKIGHEWEEKPLNRYNGRNCPVCSSHKVLSGFNDLMTTNPQLAEEWNYSKNALTPQEVTKSSGKKVWWKCKQGHEWEATINSRDRGSGCPFCGNKKVLTGFNDLNTVYPNIANEWDYFKNTPFSPNNVVYSSHLKMWWICSTCGYSWKTSVVSRTIQGTGCPKCSASIAAKQRKKMAAKVNSFVEKHPELLEEWDKNSELNNEIDPNECSSSSHIIVHWKCQTCGFEWNSSIKNRTSGHGCPKCGTQKSRDSFRENLHNNKKSLFYCSPELMNEWNYEKNGDIDPKLIGVKSSKKVWWKCKLGHEWEAQISNRQQGQGCPYCSGRYVLKDINSLIITNPDLASEWHPTRNGNLTPNDVLENSTKVVWWLGKCGHEWEASVHSRNAGRGRGCPICSAESRTSFPEQAIYYYVKKLFPDAINGDREVLGGKELDIYIPSIKVAVEYDGIQWHTIEKDLEKSNACKKLNITLYRIREKGLPLVENCVSIIRESFDDNGLNQAINDLLSAINKTIDVDVSRDKSEIMNQYIISKKTNSLSVLHPELVLEWNNERNGALTPNMFSVKSSQKVWWKCSKCGNEWKAVISSRSGGTGCPICGRVKADIGRSKPVINIDTGVSYASLDAAAKAMGVNRSTNIAACCKGKIHTAYGYHWKFIEK